MEKSTTIRIKENTKQELDLLSKGKETYDELIKRLMRDARW